VLAEMTHPQVTVVEHPLIRARLAILRAEATPPDGFRRALTELSALMVAEVTRGFSNRSVSIQSPLEPCEAEVSARPIVIAPILRAGLGMAEGMLRILSEASVAHIGMYRDEESLRPKTYYYNGPEQLADSEVLVLDPMLATGWSAAAAVAQLREKGAVSMRFVCLVSCPQGLGHFATKHPDVPVFTAAIDRELNERGYILPGLGDAGDRFFGTGS